MVDFLGTVEQGLRIGSSLGEAIDRKAAAKHQRLIGGHKRRSLGLGGESEKEQEIAQKELLSSDPEAFKKFTAQFENLDTAAQKQLQVRNSKIGLAATDLIGMGDRDLSGGIANTAQAFLDSGEPELAQQAQQLSALAQTNPSDARQQLQALQTQSREVEDAISSSQGGVRGGAKFQKSAGFITKDKSGTLTFNQPTFDPLTNKTTINREPITESLVSKLGETGDEQSLRLIEESGGKAGAEAKSRLSVKAAQDAFEKVVTIDAGIKLLDEGIAALEEGADVGIVDKFLPSIKEASSRFDNVADRMGLQVVQSVTFGALSAGELKVAMATAVPPNLDNKQLQKWFKERKSAQNKLRNFYVDIAKKASEEGKTPAEIMIEINDKKGKNTTSSEAPEIATQAEFDALPSGSQFLEDGKLRTKQ